MMDDSWWFYTTCIQTFKLAPESRFCEAKVFEETQSIANLPSVLGLLLAFWKKACDSTQMDSDEDERESHRVFLPRFVLSGAPPNRRLDCILQTVTWGKCLSHRAEAHDDDEDGPFN